MAAVAVSVVLQRPRRSCPAHDRSRG
jgi:hypothetical protein